MREFVFSLVNHQHHKHTNFVCWSSDLWCVKESIEFYHGNKQEAEMSDLLLAATIDAWIEWLKSSVPLIAVIVLQVFVAVLSIAS